MTSSLQTPSLLFESCKPCIALNFKVQFLQPQSRHNLICRPSNSGRRKKDNRCKYTEIACTKDEVAPAPRIKGSEYVLTLKRPLGMTLAENADRKEVFVESLVKGGNAEATGKVRVGDIISK